MKTILITGAAGFIGYHTVKRLCREGGFQLVGIDNLNAYYDPALKRARLGNLGAPENFTFHELDLADREGMDALFARVKPDIVLNFAAQAGVRHSLDHPHDYVRSNLDGFMNVLEGCRNHGAGHLIFASSSSVYGANGKIPFSVRDPVDHPVSLYAATKKAGELMAHSYAHLYRLPCTGLRFFTVYGPWGRPDMAYYKFAEAIRAGKPIEVYNHGDMKRDFTYIDDIVEALVRLVRKDPPQLDPDWNALTPDPASSNAPYRLYNIGNNRPEKLTDMIAFLEDALGEKAHKTLLPMQPGDVYETYADIDDLERAVDFRPQTSLKDGLARFVEWYDTYCGRS